MTLSSPTLTTVDALLARAGCGDLGAFRDLYDATAPRVFGLARSLVLDPTRAEDVTQDAFLDIWRRSPRYDPARSTGIPWILMITHARAVDHIRRAERAGKYDTVGARMSAEGADYDQIVDTVMARHGSPALQVAVDALTSLQRQAIQVTYWGGLTGPQASQILGIPLPTFKARLHDAMVALRAADTAGTRPLR